MEKGSLERKAELEKLAAYERQEELEQKCLKGLEVLFSNMASAWPTAEELQKGSAEITEEKLVSYEAFAAKDSKLELIKLLIADSASCSGKVTDITYDVAYDVYGYEAMGHIRSLLTKLTHANDAMTTYLRQLPLLKGKSQANPNPKVEP